MTVLRCSVLQRSDAPVNCGSIGILQKSPVKTLTSELQFDRSSSQTLEQTLIWDRNPFYIHGSLLAPYIEDAQALMRCPRMHRRSFQKLAQRDPN